MVWKPDVIVAVAVERTRRDRHQSPPVVRCMGDYVAGIRAPLDLRADYN